MMQPDEQHRGIVERLNGGERMDRSEMALSATGIGLAAFAAFFPWYVFFHHEQFAARHDGLAQNMVRDLPVGPPKPVYSVSPSASINANGTPAGMAMALPKDLDNLRTGTITEQDKPAAGEGNSDLNQPLPGRSNAFKLLHVSGGKALIEDEGGMYIVGVGSALPDNSSIKSIEQRDGNWVIVTSSGNVVGIN